jgi:hypothetical protein
MGPTNPPKNPIPPITTAPKKTDPKNPVNSGAPVARQMYHATSAAAIEASGIRTSGAGSGAMKISMDNETMANVATAATPATTALTDETSLS